MGWGLLLVSASAELVLEGGSTAAPGGGRGRTPPRVGGPGLGGTGDTRGRSERSRGRREKGGEASGGRGRAAGAGCSLAGVRTPWWLTVRGYLFRWPGVLWLAERRPAAAPVYYGAARSGLGVTGGSRASRNGSAYTVVTAEAPGESVILMFSERPVSQRVGRPPQTASRSENIWLWLC